MKESQLPAGDPTDMDIRESVRRKYIRAVEDGCGCQEGASCCGDSALTAETISQTIGYSPEELAAVPEGSNLGLGCGNPQAIAELKPGEVVLDLGSGAGFDCFLAARAVGASGRVIGVDMTPEMIEKGRENVRKGDYDNVEFRLGEIEHLPVADATMNVIISNCVINLSVDKAAVYREANRVLKPGGRLAISDVVATADVPPEVRNDLGLWSACAAGALTMEELRSILKETGFEQVEIVPVEPSRDLIREWNPENRLDRFFVSSTIRAQKPE